MSPHEGALLIVETERGSWLKLPPMSIGMAMASNSRKRNNKPRTKPRVAKAGSPAQTSRLEAWINREKSVSPLVR